MDNTEERQTCGQCYKKIEGPVVKRTILYRNNGRSEKAVVHFCSETCGAHYQMACEG